MNSEARTQLQVCEEIRHHSLLTREIVHANRAGLAIAAWLHVVVTTVQLADVYDAHSERNAHSVASPRGRWALHFSLRKARQIVWNVIFSSG